MSTFDTKDKETMICPYCGHDFGYTTGGMPYVICNYCEKPFKVDVVITKLNEHWPHEYAVTTTAIAGVE